MNNIFKGVLKAAVAIPLGSTLERIFCSLPVSASNSKINS